MNKEEEIFEIPYAEEPRRTVTVTYRDNSIMEFDNEIWNTMKAGIKKNLYDKDLIKKIEIATNKNTDNE